MIPCVMRIRHNDAELESMEGDPDWPGKIAPEIVRGFRKVLTIVRSVTNETELRMFRSLNFEKLKGDRSHQWSMRINDQYRVIVEIEHGEGPNNNCIVVKKVEDYHH